VADLNLIQKNFLAQHNIPLSWVFDASGLRRNEYSTIMREEEKYFAYGVSQCLNGHELRSRKGNCIQCRPANIAFELRHHAAAYVYIAGSIIGKLIKIGSSKDPHNRLYIANLDSYAGLSDWQPLYSAYVPRAGKIETGVQSALSLYQRRIEFCRNGVEQVANECFACSYHRAHFWLCLTLLGDGIFKLKQWDAGRDTLEKYEFDEK
jgi:hypothetical protein